VVLGDTAEEILKHVQSEGMDLIIMGSHGRKGLDKVIFGSVDEKVVKTAPVPVMVVNPYNIVT
jgi:nucleotide-binding universal stress UspA family protein